MTNCNDCNDDDRVCEQQQQRRRTPKPRSLTSSFSEALLLISDPDPDSDEGTVTSILTTSVVPEAVGSMDVMVSEEAGMPMASAAAVTRLSLNSDTEPGPPGVGEDGGSSGWFGGGLAGMSGISGDAGGIGLEAVSRGGKGGPGGGSAQLMDQEGDALLSPGARSPRLRETPIATSSMSSPTPPGVLPLIMPYGL